MVPWSGKYKPLKLNEVVGQDRSVKQIHDFISNYKKQKKKALLIGGPTGCGKTCAVQAAAEEFDCELVEVNASDKRNAAAVKEVIGNSLKQQSLFFKQKIILIDEIDSLSGTKDRGGVSELAKLIRDSKFPIIMTANNAYSDKLKSVRKLSAMAVFNQLKTEDIVKVLEKVCKKEKIKHEKQALSALARRAKGDARGAVTDLEILTCASRELKQDNVLEITEREKKQSILQALSVVFKGTDLDVTRKAFSNINENFDEILLWLDWNLPKEYTKDSLARAYDWISKADVFKGRIRRWQYWRFLVYIDALLSGGVGSAKDQPYKQFVSYERSRRLLTMWILNNKYAKRKSIAQKLAEKNHCSTRRAIDSLAYLKPIFRKEKGAEITDWLKLDTEEVAWLKK